MKKEYAQKIINELQEDYNLVASSFASTRDRLWPEVKFLFDYAKKGDRVLDVGCGNGRFCKYLEKGKYTGVDFSEKMIEEAKKRFPKKDFRVANALSLPFQGETFDKVYAIAVIHQIPSEEYRKQFLAEMERVLKPGGQLFLTAWNLEKKGKLFLLKNAFSNIFSPLGSRDFLLKRKRYYYIFKKGELSSLCRKAGFVVEKEGEANKKGRSNYYVVALKKQID